MLDRRLGLGLIAALFVATAPACATKQAAGGTGSQPPPPELAAVYYASGSKKLSFADKPAVQQAATELQTNTELHLLLIGRTDSHGNSNTNMQLGLTRARELRDAILEHAQGAIPHDRIHVGSRGQAEPSASNETEDGRSINRRVEFYFFYPDGTQLAPRFASPIIIENDFPKP